MSEEPEKRRHPLEMPVEPPPPEDEPKAKRIPVVLATSQATITYVLIAINVVIFFVGYLSPEIQKTLFSQFALFPKEVLGNFQLHRLVTVMFLHGDIAHLMFNMIALYNIGQRVEKLYGRERFLIVYFLGGLVASIFSAGIGAYDIPSVGASGAILALWAAEIWMLYVNRVFFGENARQILQADAFFLVITLVTGFLPGSRIDNWAHIGGFVGGLAIVYLIPVRLKVVNVRQPDQNMKIVIIDGNRFNPSMLPLIGMMGVALLALLVLAILGFRIPLFPLNSPF